MHSRSRRLATLVQGAADQGQQGRAADWLEAAGVAVPRDAQGHVASPIEISPLYALDAQQLAEKVDPKLTIRPEQEVYLE